VPSLQARAADARDSNAILFRSSPAPATAAFFHVSSLRYFWTGTRWRHAGRTFSTMDLRGRWRGIATAFLCGGVGVHSIYAFLLRIALTGFYAGDMSSVDVVFSSCGTLAHAGRTLPPSCASLLDILTLRAQKHMPARHSTNGASWRACDCSYDTLA